MLVQSVRKLFLVAIGALLVLPIAPHAALSELHSLDGKSFVGEFVQNGKTSGDKDTISFVNGRFRSSACDRYGYGDAAYRATSDGSITRFEAETESARYGKLIWKGTVNGSRLESTATMLQPGRAPVEHRAWGELAR